MKLKKIVFVDETLEKSFNTIDKNDPIKKALTKAIQSLKEDAFSGRNVKKKLIPKDLIQKYKINNLWIYNLPNAWRMLYSLTDTGEIEIIAAILDWMNHKEYARLFKF